MENTFNEATFRSKVGNIFVKLYSAVTDRDLSEVKHFISDDVYNYFMQDVKKMLNNKQIHIYDEINVKDIVILNREINDEYETVKINLISRYMDYIIDEATGKTLSGIDNHRIEKNNYLIFKKKIIIKNSGMVKKCPGCGAPIDVNANGKCHYCGRVFNLEDYDYILDSIVNE